MWVKVQNDLPMLISSVSGLIILTSYEYMVEFVAGKWIETYVIYQFRYIKKTSAILAQPNIV